MQAGLHEAPRPSRAVVLPEVKGEHRLLFK